MKVFTEEWISQLEKRYGRLPNYQKPVTYIVATGDHNRSVRLKIEEWITSLSLQPEVEREIIRRLRTPEHFIHTYHELIFADILRQRGFALEYEKQIDGLTPDWFVNAKGEIPAFILEVFTANVSAARNSERHQVSQLRSRLQEIPVSVALDIQSEKLDVELDNQRCKAIAAKVRNWLLNNTPSIGEQLEVDEFTFVVVHYNSNYERLQPIGPVTTFWVNSQPMRANFQGKISKYRKVATENKLPLVVGVIADFYTGIGFDDLEIILLGRTTENVLYDETGKAIGREITCTKDGLFVKEPTLSAVVWAERSSIDKTEVRAIHNSLATNPLPESTFF